MTIRFSSGCAVNDVATVLARFGFRHVWAVDFEFIAHTGDKPRTVCMVARCLLTGATVRQWGGELARCPFTCGDDELFVAYYASAEASCFDALGWPRPRRMLDLFAEFRRLTNGGGNAHGNSLIGALLHFGVPTIGSEEKTAMRDLVMGGGPWTDGERRQILDYCESDVDAVLRLLPAIIQAAGYNDADFGRALLRGRYMVAAGAVENNGIPIDADLLSRLARHWSSIKNQLIRAIDADYGVYDGTGDDLRVTSSRCRTTEPCTSPPILLARSNEGVTTRVTSHAAVAQACAVSVTTHFMGGFTQGLGLPAGGFVSVTTHFMGGFTRVAYGNPPLLKAAHLPEAVRIAVEDWPLELVPRQDVAEQAASLRGP